MTFLSQLEDSKKRTDLFLHLCIEEQSEQARLQEALRYVVHASGKGLRPHVTYLVGDTLEIPATLIDPVAGAIELIHCYSLVHDDLPDMDNSPTRRGRPSCWKAFDPATALLTGDALLTLAFEALAQAYAIPAQQRCIVIRTLAQAIGAQGMVAGQMMDMFPQSDWRLEDILKCQFLKTGSLISCCFEAPAIIALKQYADREFFKHLGKIFGIMYQITDDFLDVEETPETIGKPVGQDQGKKTFLSFLGHEKAKEYLVKLNEEARNLLRQVPKQGGKLNDLFDWVISRKK